MSSVRAGLALLLFAAGCASGGPRTEPPPQRTGSPLPPPLPDTTGWGVQALAIARSPTGELWVGTSGQGIYVLREDTADWENVVPQDGDASSLSWPFVNSIAFTDSASAEVWYGTIGNGFGRSTNGGRSWQNWQRDQLGTEWLYVAPQGIATRGDTVYIATSNGLRITADGGATWSCVVGTDAEPDGAQQSTDDCETRTAALPTEYLLSIDTGPEGEIWVGHLEGVSVSEDGGRNWRNLTEADGIPSERFRSVTVNHDSVVWAASETTIYVDSAREGTFAPANLRFPGWPGLPGAPRALVPSPGLLPPSIATSFGLAVGDGGGQYRMYYLAAGETYRPAADIWDMAWWGPPLWPIGASSAGLNRVLAGESRPPGHSLATPAPPPADPRHPWFARPIALEGANPYVDASYRYGATMGRRFQQQQGVNFNNPTGTPVHAIGDGVVVFAGQSGAGSNTVAIRHDQRVGDGYVFSTYHHNTSIAAQPGQRVQAGDVIAGVGNSGSATHDHLHFEVHVAPTQDSAAIVNSQERVPPHTVNPQLWIEPLPGTGIVAGRVMDADGELVAGARVYGLVLPYPDETPFSFAETYSEGARGSPGYDENFVVGDVVAGQYRLGVVVNGARVWRRIRVEAGKVTFVDFQP